jgi:hypothetical protein
MKRYLVLLTLLVVIFGVLSLRGDTQKPRGNPRIIDPGASAQLVFFAVLEGLYEDGVSTDDADRLLAVDPKTKQPQFEQHFVYGCPLCMPAFDAMVVYRSRPRFHGRKDNADTFGPGLEASIKKKLESAQKTDQLEAIQTLVTRWVGRRLDSMRLTKEEREQWTAVIEDGRQKGMGFLQTAQAGNRNEYLGWKGCAICDGSAGACQTSR